MNLYIALLHYPVVNRNKQLITSSVTNLDLHDIARTCRTFGVKRYFVVHPSDDEQALNRRIVHHWESGYGKLAHSTRAEALELIELVKDFETVEKRIEELSGKPAYKVGTSARKSPKTISSEELISLSKDDRSVLLVFGTAYGLSNEWQENLDTFLEPISVGESYNHLSVRSAVAIYLDRLIA